MRKTSFYKAGRFSGETSIGQEGEIYPHGGDPGRLLERGGRGRGPGMFNCQWAQCTKERTSPDSTSMFRPPASILHVGNCPQIELHIFFFCNFTNSVGTDGDLQQNSKI